jgi:chemotaxis family two-component system response regulator Rcp1
MRIPNLGHLLVWHLRPANVPISVRWPMMRGHTAGMMNTNRYGERESSTALEVLLVEDSAGDVRLTKEAFAAANLTVNLSVAADGVEAMAFLRREGIHANAPRPDLTLLDLNMPRMDGREVLAEIKKDEKLKTIPIVILTTSESEGDIVKSYKLHANCYLCKPVQLTTFEDLVKSINDFWLTRARLPQVQ